MVLRVFSIFDTKAGVFMLPFYASSVGVAMRNVSRAVKDPTTDFHHFASDYCLFELGEWDPESGKFRMLDAPFSHGLVSVFAARTEVSS